MVLGECRGAFQGYGGRKRFVEKESAESACRRQVGNILRRMGKETLRYKERVMLGEVEMHGIVTARLVLQWK